jgi:threonine dehydrogenase-like Zn-dependent dehydrogenase
MKAIAVSPGTRKLETIDLPRPRPVRRTDVLARVLDVGVCGTDREICAFEYGTPPAGSEHLVIGHEALCEVVEVGPDVTRVRPGDLVVPMVRRPCAEPDCQACRESRQDFCYTGLFRERGIKEANGFMTELVVDDEEYMNVVPRELRDVGVLTEPLTIAEKALRQIDEVQARLPWACRHEIGKPAGHCHRAVVLGAGPVGLLGAMALAATGFAVTVYSRERAPNAKAELARGFGADYVSAEEVTPEALAARVGNIDVVYEASGASAASFELMKVLGTNGIFVFTGVPGRKAPIALDADLLMKRMVLRNQVLFGTVNADRGAFESAIRHLAEFDARWPAALRGLVTGRFPVAEHERLLTGRASGIKNVIELAAGSR